MLSNDFCKWLQGILDTQESLSSKELTVIRDTLKCVNLTSTPYKPHEFVQPSWTSNRLWERENGRSIVYTTNEESPHWAPGAVYRNPNLK